MNCQGGVGIALKGLEGVKIKEKCKWSPKTIQQAKAKATRKQVARKNQKGLKRTHLNATPMMGLLQKVVEAGTPLLQGNQKK